MGKNRQKSKKAGCTHVASPPKVWWAVAILILAFGISMHLTVKNVQSYSPTFDEPFHLFQATHLQQTSELYLKDVHPPGLPFVLSLFVPLIADFKNVDQFIDDPKNFVSPYQYRLDIFSNTKSDHALQPARYIFLSLWHLTVLALVLSLLHLKWSVWLATLSGVFLMLEPSLLGLSGLLTNDILMTFFLSWGLLLGLKRSWALSAMSFLLFFMAWMTKFTAVLGIVPIAILVVNRKTTYKMVGLWLAGLGAALIVVGFGDLVKFGDLSQSNFRTTYLNNLHTLRPSLHYFLQVTLNKFSHCFWLLAGGVLYFTFRNPSAQVSFFKCLAFVIASFFATSFFLPGLGLRLVLPLALTLLIIFISQLHRLQPKKQALLFVAFTLALAVESWYFSDRHLAFQNYLAGQTPRAVDSNLDWGQGLKEAIAWVQRDNKPVALSLFGGTLPETYGLKDYRALSSYPELAGGKSLTTGEFTGYVVISRNFLHDYIVDDPNLEYFKVIEPLRCFAGALCLFDVRSSQ